MPGVMLCPETGGGATPYAEPPVTGRSLLTEADSELTIVLPSGHEITVVLGPSGMVMPWDRPAAQGGAVVRVSTSGGWRGAPQPVTSTR